jgi:hypothetical protein
VLSSRPVPEAPVRVQTALPPGGPGELPFRLIGETVQVQRRGEQLQVFHRGELVANHPVLSGKYQMRILPEHGPGAVGSPRFSLGQAVILDELIEAPDGRKQIHQP